MVAKHELWFDMLILETIFMAVNDLYIYGQYVRDSYLARTFIDNCWDFEGVPLFLNNIRIYIDNMQGVNELLKMLMSKGVDIVNVGQVYAHPSDPNYEIFEVEIKFMRLQLILTITLCKKKKSSFFIKENFSFSVDTLYMCNKKVGISPYYMKMLGMKNSEETELQKILYNIRMRRAPIFSHCAPDIKYLESVGWNCTFSDSLKTTSFMKAPGESCLICLGDLDFSIGHKRGCCNAHYHHKCYKKVLHTQERCPMCRVSFGIECI
jgi:hypothetical protein